MHMPHTRSSWASRRSPPQSVLHSFLAEPLKHWKTYGKQKTTQISGFFLKLITVWFTAQIQVVTRKPGQSTTVTPIWMPWHGERKQNHNLGIHFSRTSWYLLPHALSSVRYCPFQNTTATSPLKLLHKVTKCSPQGGTQMQCARIKPKTLPKTIVVFLLRLVGLISMQSAIH